MKGGAGSVARPRVARRPSLISTHYTLLLQSCAPYAGHEDCLAQTTAGSSRAAIDLTV